MLDTSSRFDLGKVRAVLVVILLLAVSAYMGLRPRFMYLALIVACGAGLLMLWQPPVGLIALITSALALPREFGTGTEVAINPASVLVPALVGLWLVHGFRRRNLSVVSSPVNRPLILFLLSGLLSILVGNAFWDPAVPRSGNMTIVQVAQWSIFAFSAGALWLMGNLVRNEIWLRRVTWSFLIVGGGLAILFVIPGLGRVTSRIVTGAFIRAPFWALLVAMTGGQLLFNHSLDRPKQLFLGAVVLAVLYYAFVIDRRSASTWIGVTVVVGTLFWLRFPRARLPSILVVLVAFPIVSALLFNFGGGEAEWEESGGSRMVLIQRVVEVTMHNPITGLGPASYRAYANVKPLMYLGAFWVSPQVNSHNNYVDLFAHVGLLGLGLFFWFLAELGWLGWKLGRRFREGFLGGYANSMVALWAATLVLMAFADWILPFVYNIGFFGFQASVLVWLFLGGTVALVNFTREEAREV